MLVMLLLLLLTQSFPHTEAVRSTYTAAKNQDASIRLTSAREEMGQILASLAVGPFKLHPDFPFGRVRCFSEESRLWTAADFRDEFDFDFAVDERVHVRDGEGSAWADEVFGVEVYVHARGVLMHARFGSCHAESEEIWAGAMTGHLDVDTVFSP